MLSPFMKGLKDLFSWRLQPQEAPPETKVTDGYFEKLLRYIPADIIAGWVALTGILTQSAADVPWWFNWAVFFSLLFLTPFYVCYLKTTPIGMTSKKLFHWVTSCIAFTVWVFAMGGPPFSALAWNKPVFGSVLLIVVTLAIPVFERFFVRPPSGGSGDGDNPPSALPPTGKP